MYTILPESSGAVVGMRVSETLTHADLDQIAADLKPYLSKDARINVLILMEDFHGWESVSAMLQDLKIDAQANKHVDRIAMVGEAKWQKWMAWFTKAVARGELKYFDRAQLAQAWEWLRQSA